EVDRPRFSVRSGDVLQEEIGVGIAAAKSAGLVPMLAVAKKTLDEDRPFIPIGDEARGPRVLVPEDDFQIDLRFFVETQVARSTGFVFENGGRHRRRPPFCPEVESTSRDENDGDSENSEVSARGIAHFWSS